MLYRPVDLSNLRNIRADVLDGAPARADAQKLRDLPLDIADDVALDAGGELTVAVDDAAAYVIVAHRLLEGVRADVQSVGSPVAEHLFTLSDGAEHSVTVRYGFEDQRVPMTYGIDAYRYGCVLDTEDPLLARDQCCSNGARQTQTSDIGAQFPRGNWYLWVWENPSPGTRLDRIALRGLGARVLIGGITLGDKWEDPPVQLPSPVGKRSRLKHRWRPRSRSRPWRSW